MANKYDEITATELLLDQLQKNAEDVRMQNDAIIERIGSLENKLTEVRTKVLIYSSLIATVTTGSILLLVKMAIPQ
jgi:hypothetical protein